MSEMLRQQISDSEENYRNTTFWEVYPLFLLVREGESERLGERLHIQLEKFPAGRITRDRRRQLEYLAVSLINTFMIAAIEGGVYPPDANAAADRALRRLAGAKSAAEYPAVVEDAALRLSGLVSAAKGADTGNAHADRARHYMDTHLTREIHTEDIAAAVGVSPYHLSRVFKAATGQTLREYLLRARIGMAKRLLAAGEYTIPEIASLLCFCDQSCFTRVFRESVGMTPKAYRERQVCKTVCFRLDTCLGREYTDNKEVFRYADQKME